MAKSEQEVAEELRGLGCTSNTRQLTELAQHLLSDESIVYALDGRGANVQKLTAIVTPQRLILMHYHPPAWLANETFSIGHVYWSDVTQTYFVRGEKNHFYLSVVNVSQRGVDGYFHRDGISEGQFKKLASIAEEHIASWKRGGPPGQPLLGSAAIGGSHRGGLIDQLERLATLREKGHITKDEFEQAKRKLLQGN